MNNDRFKFRVWYPAAEQYCANFSLDSDGVVWSGHTVLREGFTLEFCTGFKDKTGKLIYEGDILKDSDGDDTLTIVYQNGALGYVWAKQFHTMPEWIKDFVVIGNIHEANGAHGADGESEDKHE